MRYQETWIRGKSAGQPFQRECASRYEPIREALEAYKRPFSVFDFGANMGYFSFRIAEDFPHATVVAVDSRKDLPALARDNGLPNVVVLSRRMSATELAQMAKCEAFDVVLALNVLHHMQHWSVALSALERLGSVIYAETPGPGDHGAVGRRNHDGVRKDLAASGQEVMRSPAHTSPGAERIMYRLDNWQGRTLSAQTMDAITRGAPKMGRVEVSLTTDAARISFDRGEARDFIPGINLWNAHMNGLSWPVDVKARILAEVERLEAEGRWHDDLRPWNFILSGDRAVAIDIGNKAWRTEPEPGGLQRCMAML